MSLPRHLQADLALAGVTVIWGASFVIIKVALQDVSPLVFVLLRFAVAGAFLLVLSGVRQRLWEPGLARAGSVVGFFLFAGFVFQTFGLQYTTPAKSAFITALSVVMVPVILVAFFRRRLELSTVAGVVAATLGVYLLTARGGALAIGQGDLLTLVSAVAFAGHIVAVGRYAPHFGVAALTLWQVGVAGAFSALLTPLAAATGLEVPQMNWTPRLVAALVATGGLSLALAFTVQVWAQQFTSPTHTAIIYSLEPVFAALTSYLVLAERFGPQGFLGAGLILAGVVLAELRAPAAAELGMPPPR
ncbi:MAG: DMT family transporter [Candidatus Acidiferrales bacterium]